MARTRTLPSGDPLYEDGLLDTLASALGHPARLLGWWGAWMVLCVRSAWICRRLAFLRQIRGQEGEKALSPRLASGEIAFPFNPQMTPISRFLAVIIGVWSCVVYRQAIQAPGSLFAASEKDSFT